MKPEDQYDEVMAAIEELRELNEAIPVIVEGPEDRRSLLQLGLPGDILALNTGSSIFAFCEAYARDHRDAILLTDWDRRGGHLCRLLRDGLTANGVRWNDAIRARLTILCRREIKDVQGLVGYLGRLEARRSSSAVVTKRARAVRARRARRISGEGIRGQRPGE